jgi:hypothetical protein
MLYLIHNKIKGMSSRDSDVGHYNIIRNILCATNSDIHIPTENLKTPNTQLTTGRGNEWMVKVLRKVCS